MPYFTNEIMFPSDPLPLKCSVRLFCLLELLYFAHHEGFSTRQIFSPPNTQSDNVPQQLAKWRATHPQARSAGVQNFPPTANELNSGRRHQLSPNLQEETNVCRISPNTATIGASPARSGSSLHAPLVPCPAVCQYSGASGVGVHHALGWKRPASGLCLGWLRFDTRKIEESNQQLLWVCCLCPNFPILFPFKRIERQQLLWVCCFGPNFPVLFSFSTRIELQQLIWVSCLGPNFPILFLFPQESKFSNCFGSVV